MEALRGAALKVADQGAVLLEGQGRRNASGRPGPRVVSGTLRREILASPAEATGTNSFRAEVVSGAVYGRIQEKGGTIVPKNRQFLSWIDAGGTRHFALRVTLPARPYFTPARAMVEAPFMDLARGLFAEALMT
jgi:hypothetical protein